MLLGFCFWDMKSVKGMLCWKTFLTKIVSFFSLFFNERFLSFSYCSFSITPKDVDTIQLFSAYASFKLCNFKRFIGAATPKKTYLTKIYIYFFEGFGLPYSTYVENLKKKQNNFTE